MSKCLQVTNEVSKLVNKIGFTLLFDKFTFTMVWLEFWHSTQEHNSLERDSSQQSLIPLSVVYPLPRYAPPLAPSAIRRLSACRYMDTPEACQSSVYIPLI